MTVSFTQFPLRLMNPMKRIAASVLVLLMATACDSLLPDWLGSNEAPPLPGQRISVLTLEKSLEPDPGLSDLDVRLPAPYINGEWPQAGGVPAHVMHHLAIGGSLRLRWSISVGDGASDDAQILTTPVVGGGRIYVLDTGTRLGAYDAQSGKQLWRVRLTPLSEDEGGFGGGVAYADDRLYVTTGFGDVFALSAENGGMYWRHKIGVPIRSAPTVSDGKVFVVSYDNQLHALSLRKGEEEWIHTGIAENAGLLGGASPAAEQGAVVAAYSSGEIVALRSDNGSTAWADSLTRVGRLDSLATLSDINGLPLLDRGTVYAISHSGRMIAVDQRTGSRVWEQRIAGIQTPWIAGDFIFLVTTEEEVVCLSRKDGRIRWVRALARFEDPEDRTDPITWAGPVLAGDRLILVSNDARAVAISPYDGKVLGVIDLPGPVSVPPIIANQTLYIHTDEGELLAYN